MRADLTLWYMNESSWPATVSGPHCGLLMQFMDGSGWRKEEFQAHFTCDMSLWRICYLN